MLDAAIKGQLKSYLERLQQPIELVASLDDGTKSQELHALLEDIDQLSDKVQIRLDGYDERRPSFTVGRPGESARIRFAGFILHDSEDVISPLELRLFNHLVARKDLIQLPVYPLPGHWYQFTRSHYLDEFAETHGKDVIVREALIGQVPSAGVGTCFSRRAIQLLQEEGDGVVFDTKSLTEDYDIGFRLAAHGLHGVFVRFEDLPAAMQGHDGHSVRNAQIGVREYFPDRLSLAVRQKARWVVGIVFQGMKNLRWSRRPLVNYFLWRDRRGALTNLVSFAAFAVLLQLAGMQLVYLAWPDAWHFQALIATGSLLWYLLLVNGLLFLLRMGSRGYFVWHSYGPVQALLSVPDRKSVV